jgi:5'-methylthioinosine phosphorylase
MSSLGIIGGTGLTSLKGLEIVRREVVNTPYGEPSGPLIHGTLQGHAVTFLARHGYGHNIPPHKVNYRANVWALRQVGLRNIIAVAAVGGIKPALTPGRLAIPDQIIDYTWGRGHTLFEDELQRVVHVDFTFPYCQTLRTLMLQAATHAGLDVHDGGTYGAMQGPRLESKAEIDRLERDGCDMVGMTGMPETALAREAGLCYAACAVIANPAAGRAGTRVISMDEIDVNLRSGMDRVRKLLEHVVPLLVDE